ncbi:MAG: hypothetical protein M3461_24080, partial [Pseudomonadota bacterium]|nr:hypothetical protein [Pseudomonadota bacterium]
LPLFELRPFSRFNSIDSLVFGMTVSIAIARESVKLFKGHSTSKPGLRNKLVRHGTAKTSRR